MSGKRYSVHAHVFVLIMDQDQYRTSGLAGNRWGETDLHSSKY